MLFHICGSSFHHVYASSFIRIKLQTIQNVQIVHTTKINCVKFSTTSSLKQAPVFDKSRFRMWTCLQCRSAVAHANGSYISLHKTSMPAFTFHHTRQDLSRKIRFANKKRRLVMITSKAEVKSATCRQLTHLTYEVNPQIQNPFLSLFLMRDHFAFSMHIYSVFKFSFHIWTMDVSMLICSLRFEIACLLRRHCAKQPA